jgi:hypothetical protein
VGSHAKQVYSAGAHFHGQVGPGRGSGVATGLFPGASF